MSGDSQSFIVATMPTIPGYKVKKVIGIVSGITPRTRGILGKFIAGIESMIGGEVTAFSYEIEKATRRGDRQVSGPRRWRWARTPS